MKVGLHTRLRAGMEERYEKAHEAVWPEVLEAIRRAGIRELVIFRDGLDLFHCIECDDYEGAIAELAALPVNRRWQAEMAPMMEVAHDYGGGGSDRLPVVFEL
jgi:L-rhamnose mutarotase